MIPEPELRVIDGIEYKCQQHGGEKLLWFWATLVKLLTEPLALLLVRVISELKSLDIENIRDFLDSGIDFKSIASAIPDGLVRISEKLTPDEYVSLVKNFLSQTFVNNRCVLDDFNNRFMGRMLHLHKLLAFALEVNFKDFFTLFQASLPQETSSESTSRNH